MRPSIIRRNREENSFGDVFDENFPTPSLSSARYTEEADSDESSESSPLRLISLSAGPNVNLDFSSSPDISDNFGDLRPLFGSLNFHDDSNSDTPDTSETDETTCNHCDRLRSILFSKMAENQRLISEGAALTNTLFDVVADNMKLTIDASLCQKEHIPQITALQEQIHRLEATLSLPEQQAQAQVQALTFQLDRTHKRKLQLGTLLDNKTEQVAELKDLTQHQARVIDALKVTLQEMLPQSTPSSRPTMN
jgi:hypothetical protein